MSAAALANNQVSNGIRPVNLRTDLAGLAELLEICFNLVPGGIASRYLFDLAEGARLQFTGPWGTFTMRDPPDVECVFIADGTGIAPIRPMLRRAIDGAGGTSIRLSYRAASRESMLYREEFERLQHDHRRFGFDPILDESSDALVTVMRQRYVETDDDRSRHFYVCGVGDVVTRLRDLLRGAGYARRAVEYEKW